MTVRAGKTAAETDRSRGEARQRNFTTAHSSIMAGFYEPRITNHGLLDSDAAFRRDRFKLTTTLREALSA